MNTSQSVQALIEKITSLPAERIAEVEKLVDCLRDRTLRRWSANDNRLPGFPVDHLGKWPEGLSPRREGMYGDHERCTAAN